MGKRNQERRRAKKKQRETRQRARAGSGSQGDHPFSAGPFDGGPFDAGPFGAGPSAPPRRPTLPEILDTMMLGILEAPDEAAPTAIESCAADLAASPGSGPAGWHSVSRALLDLGERMVRGCWENGWQPADLVRVAGRELTARHVRLAVSLVAAEVRRYGAAGLDGWCSGQLRDLKATVWWDDDGSYLDAAGGREGLDRLGTVTCHLELLRLFGLLPQIPPVAPPPGSGPRQARRDRVRQATTGEAVTEPDSRMLTRIRALLAKAESTDYAEEAEALTGKAQQLMARHSISAAMLDADMGGKDEPVTRRIGIDNPYEGPKALLLTAVADANRCRAVWTKYFGFSTIVGYEPDLDAVDLLYTSLLVQATTAMNRAGSKQDRHGRSRTRSFRQSFLVAYASRIGHRLAAATAQATSDAAAGIGPEDADGASVLSGPGATDARMLPVLAARADAVKDATDRMFSALTTHAPNVTDREGWAHGTAAADQAVLHGHTEVGPRSSDG